MPIVSRRLFAAVCVLSLATGSTLLDEDTLPLAGHGQAPTPCLIYFVGGSAVGLTSGGGVQDASMLHLLTKVQENPERGDAALRVGDKSEDSAMITSRIVVDFDACLSELEQDSGIKRRARGIEDQGASRERTLADGAQLDAASASAIRSGSERVEVRIGAKLAGTCGRGGVAASGAWADGTRSCGVSGEMRTGELARVSVAVAPPRLGSGEDTGAGARTVQAVWVWAGEATAAAQHLQGYPPSPLPPVLTGHVSSLLPY